MTPLAFHPLAELFPLIEGKEFDELVADIKANGLREAIVLTRAIAEGGEIIDGRNRFRACEAGEVAARFEVLPEDVDPLAYVISKNLHRRHLSDDQRRMVAAKLATVGRGRPSDNFAEREIKREEAAEMLAVDVAGVDRAKAIVAHGTEELRRAVEQGDISVNAGAQIAKRSDEEQRQELIERGILPNGARAIMSSRQEPADSLDFSPTPPWATRALMNLVLPHIGVGPKEFASAWDPACGEGHMTGVLEEYPLTVIGTDIFDYRDGEAMPPCWFKKQDFLDEKEAFPVVDWIITNPPFGDKTEPFVLRALSLAHVGVAMFVRLQWLESIGRYEAIFRDHPPTIIAFFAERVPLHMGRWEPDGTTATAYIWLVWKKGEVPRAPFWIPPGQRKALEREGDRERFTAHPVTKSDHSVDVTEKVDPETGEVIDPRAIYAQTIDAIPDDVFESSEPQHGADDNSVRTEPRGGSGPVDDGGVPPAVGLEVRTTAGAGGESAYSASAPVRDPVLGIPTAEQHQVLNGHLPPEKGGSDSNSIPDDLLRVELTKPQLAMLSRIRIEDCDRDEQAFIALARKHPEAATVASRTRLIAIAEFQGLTSEQQL